MGTSSIWRSISRSWEPSGTPHAIVGGRVHRRRSWSASFMPQEAATKPDAGKSERHTAQERSCGLKSALLRRRADLSRPR